VRLLVAGIVTTARLLVGRPVPAQGATCSRWARPGPRWSPVDRSSPSRPRVLDGALPTTRRSHPDDPGLADAIHGRRNRLKSATPIDIPRHRGAGRGQANWYIVNNPGGNELRRKPTRCRRRERAHHLRIRQLPNFQQLVDETWRIDVNIPTPMNTTSPHFNAGLPT
jgi:hypothetical protein